MDIELNKECLYDSLTFYEGDGTHGEQIGRFCGTTIPNPIKSYSYIMTIHFKSDINTHGTGFSLGWNLTAQSSSRKLY